MSPFIQSNRQSQASFIPSFKTQSDDRASWSPRPAPLSRAPKAKKASTSAPVATASRFERAVTQRGQGMTEYLIVVALISVAAIGVYSFFGQTLRNQTAGIALELSGQDASSAVTQAQTAASQAQTLAGQRRGLENYGGGNR